MTLKLWKELTAMNIKSILEKIKTIGSTDFHSLHWGASRNGFSRISLKKLIEIMEIKWNHKKRLRSSLQQAAKSLTTNNKHQPEDFLKNFTERLEAIHWWRVIENIISELTSLNEDIDLVAGGTLTSHHSKTIGKAVGTAVVTAGVAYGIKKLVKNKNTL